MSFFGTTDPRFNRGKGKVKGHTDSAVIGERRGITIVADTFETLWDIAGNFTFPGLGGESWEIASAGTGAANDTLLGTGARKVLVPGLDTSWNPQTELVEMNGTTPVVLTRTDWIRVGDPIVVDSGSGNTNDATITLRVVSAGAVRATILPENGISHNGFVSVPLGKRMFVTQSGDFAGKGDDVEVINRIMIFGTNTWIKGAFAPTYQSSNFLRFESLPTFPEKTDIEITAATEQTTISGSLQIEFTLVDNSQVAAFMASFHSRRV